MSHYARTPRMVTPMLAPQPPPVVFTNVGTPAPFYNQSLPRRQSMGHYPGQQIYHLAASEPPRSRSHHRSSSKTRKHRRSRSVDRHGSSRRHHRHRSSTPSRPMSARYPAETHYATIPSGRHRRHSTVADPRYHTSSRDPYRPVYRDPHYTTHHRESIGERIMRFFGIGHRHRYENRSGRQVDRSGRLVYAT